jgi:tetrahydromethanopterin S-methyltransferase subunit F
MLANFFSQNLKVSIAIVLKRTLREAWCEGVNSTGVGNGLVVGFIKSLIILRVQSEKFIE